MAEATQDWKTRLEELEARLEEWRAALRAEVERLTRERGYGRFRRPRESELREMEAQARASVGETVLDDASRLFDELCERFRGARPQERAAIRAAVGSHEAIFGLFWDWIEAFPELIRKPDDAPLLRQALTAIAIHDLRVTLENVNRVLGRLYLAASVAQIDPRPVFEEVAAVANPSMAGGGAQLRELLLGFERSPYFRAHVQAQVEGDGLLSPGG